MLVLVADDHPDVAHLQARLLKLNGYETEVCVHGNQVMEAIERQRPNVVLLDLSMPGMDGFDVAEELAINADLRPKLLVAVTGHGDEAIRQRTRDAGFDHHLLKPVSWSDLAPLLNSVSSKSRPYGNSGEATRAVHHSEACAPTASPSPNSIS